DPEYVKAEIDCGFARYRGLDPARYIRRYKGRAPILHLKDFHFDEGIPGDFSTFTCPAGEGVLDMGSILDSAETIGAKWLVVEQDSFEWDGLDTMGCAKRSIDNLKGYID
ncbi:MAG: sugar phosphate isomerase/epimerase, partial [Clostridia bacterium]|nr:sugar phosphate isomerase/epimerase [Clostridia bacterium]